jgi:protein-S-isoprenylcysteine O-methyltransferase Ste14
MSERLIRRSGIIDLPARTRRTKINMPGFVLTLAAVGAYGAVHSLLAGTWAKQWATRRLGRAAQRGYRLFFNLLAGVTLLPVLAVPALDPGITLYRIEMPWVLASLVLQGLGMVLVVIGLLQTGPMDFLGLSQLVDENPTGDRLVVSGLYRYMRHPLYTGGLLFIWLTPLMTTSVLALDLGLTAYLYIGSLFEERKLVDMFGEPYRIYQSRVPRFVPRPWRLWGPIRQNSSGR